MSDTPPSADTASLASAGVGSEYTVVARRYRPQTFDELIGQEHVARALTQAISSDRVGHAYLFTGARGVGKTSAARILAKALNCETGPTPTPCNACDLCQSVASGDDVDVLEIDGASNRGIDEIRQLRQNVAMRPSRARFKVYIIDEVHMLTKEAFNALLKTLEEPPEHVKFIFATTEPNKIPITILSRCQRFDFAGIDSRAIETRLQQIAAAEGVDVEPAALQILASRAAGSMRDSQSLLEQLLAVADGRITASDVNSLLGIAPAERLAELVRQLAARDTAAALGELDAALAEGVDVGQLIDQLVGYFRDVMALSVGCSHDQLRYALPTQAGEVAEVADRLGIHAVLAMLQILDQTSARLRVSLHGRTLLEMAIVRICSLEDLQELADVIGQLKVETGPAPISPARSTAQRTSSATTRGEATPAQATSGGANGDAPRSRPAEAAPPVDSGPATASAAAEPAAAAEALNDESAARLWKQAIVELGGMLEEGAANAERLTVQGDQLVASFPASYRFWKEVCERPENKARLEEALARCRGAPLALSFAVHEDTEVAGAPEPAAGKRNRREQLAKVAQRPFVRRAIELFGGDAGQFRYTPPEALS